MSSSTTEEQRSWLFAPSKPGYFKRRHKLLAEHDRWRKVAELLRLSRAARGRLEWIIFWEKNGKDCIPRRPPLRHLPQDLPQVGLPL